MTEHRYSKACLLVFAALIFVLSCLEGVAHAESSLFVASYTGNTITVYPRTADGNISPEKTIFTLPGNCPSSGDCPHAIALNESAAELFVIGNISNSVTVYDLSSGGQKRTISGPSTLLCKPTGIAVDEENQEIYVTNDSCDRVTVYPLTANGNAAPERVIEGNATGLSKPVGIGVDLTNNEISIANYGPLGPSITTFDRLASGNVAPKRVIAGSNTGLDLPQGVVLDPSHDELFVASSAFFTPNAGAIQVFRRLDSGNVAPLRTISGPGTKLCNPFHLTLDAVNNELVVANSNFAGGACAQSVTAYSRLANGDSTPLRTLAGDSTNLVNPVATAVTTSPAGVAPQVQGSTRGFVTGAGWINSPAGAYQLSPALTGYAHFKFVAMARSRTTAPSGEAEFTFRLGEFEFRSKHYESLVVDGARAQITGVGTVNGQGTYNFLISVIDRKVHGGHGVDKFRIRITDGSVLVYDNAYPGDSEQAIRGAIVIQRYHRR